MTEALGSSRMQEPSASGGTNSNFVGGRNSNRRDALTDLVAKLDHVYDLRRNCLLNELYYGYRLHKFTRMSLCLEIFIVLGSSASGVSGWVIWTTYPELKAVWAIIAAGSTLLAALKPVLHIDARIKKYSALFSGHRVLSASMASVLEEIAEARRISPDVLKEINQIRTRYRGLAVEDDPKPSRKTLMRLQDEVNRRVPVESLFYPDNSDEPHQHVPDKAGIVADIEGLGVRVSPIEPWPSARGG